MVGQRRGLLAYLKKVDIERYRALIEKLGSKKIIRFSQKEDQLTDQKLHLMMWFLVYIFLSDFWYFLSSFAKTIYFYYGI